MTPTLDLWDWRRRIAALYAAVRAAPDPSGAWHHWHATRCALFRDHPQSPIDPMDREAYRGPNIYDYDPAYRFAVELAPCAADAFDVPAGQDGVIHLRAFARTHGLHEHLGGELTVYWVGGYGGGVFLPFADATSGRETYAAGRYLLDTIKGADLGGEPGGAVVLDFNFAYFPSCAYSSRYVCPLAPPANRLPAAIRAGERLHDAAAPSLQCG